MRYVLTFLGITIETNGFQSIRAAFVSSQFLYMLLNVHDNSAFEMFLYATFLKF